MKRLLALLVVVAGIAALASGCSGDKDKGINSDKDRPIPAPAEPQKPR